MGGFEVGLRKGMGDVGWGDRQQNGGRRMEGMRARFLTDRSKRLSWDAAFGYD
jgi:hypothetical protein